MVVKFRDCEGLSLTAFTRKTPFSRQNDCAEWFVRVHSFAIGGKNANLYYNLKVSVAWKRVVLLPRTSFKDLEIVSFLCFVSPTLPNKEI